MPETEKDILKRYEERLKGKVSLEEIPSDTEFSREYTKFREEAIAKETGIYEKL